MWEQQDRLAQRQDTEQVARLRASAVARWTPTIARTNANARGLIETAQFSPTVDTASLPAPARDRIEAWQEAKSTAFGAVREVDEQLAANQRELDDAKIRIG